MLQRLLGVREEEESGEGRGQAGLDRHNEG